jgi:hypothetical protein
MCMTRSPRYRMTFRFPNRGRRQRGGESLPVPAILALINGRSYPLTGRAPRLMRTGLRALFPAQPGSATLRVNDEPGEEARDVCLCRYRRASQAFPGEGDIMPRIAEQAGPVTGGVDIHADVHVTAVVDQVGRVLGTQAFPATAAGYRAALTWVSSHGELARVRVDGTGRQLRCRSGPLPGRLRHRGDRGDPAEPPGPPPPTADRGDRPP